MSVYVSLSSSSFLFLPAVTVVISVPIENLGSPFFIPAPTIVGGIVPFSSALRSRPGHAQILTSTQRLPRTWLLKTQEKLTLYQCGIQNGHTIYIYIIRTITSVKRPHKLGILETLIISKGKQIQT